MNRPRRKLRLERLGVGPLLELVIAAPEHAGGPYPACQLYRRDRTNVVSCVVVTWAAGEHSLRVEVYSGRVEVVAVGPGHLIRLPIRGDLIGTIRDGVDHLRGIPPDRVPIPFPDTDTDTDRESEA